MDEPIRNEFQGASESTALRFDPKEHLHHLEGFEISDAEKEAFLKCLWEIMVQFVDMGFDLHPLGHVIDHWIEEVKTLDGESSDLLSSSNTQNHNESKRLAAPSPGGKAES